MQTEMLREKYKNLDVGELLEIFQSGKLSDTAYPILEGELLSRGEVIPPRPIPYEEQMALAKKNRTPFFKAHMQGERSLASAYWIVGVLGINVVAILNLGLLLLLMPIGDMFFNDPSWILTRLLWLPVLTYALFSFFCVTKCAKNARSKFWAGVAQVFSILGVAKIFLIIISA